MERERVQLWNEDKPRMAFELAFLGIEESDMPRIMDISPETFANWKRTHRSFSEALLEGTVRACGRVAAALYKRAVGYDYEEEVAHWSKDGTFSKKKITKYMPPDPWSAGRILAAKHKALWSEVQRTEVTRTNINIAKLDLSCLTPQEIAFMKSISQKQALPRATDN